MSTLKRQLTFGGIAMLALFLASVREVRAGVVESPWHKTHCRNLPVIKNLTGLEAQMSCDGIGIPKELTERDVKHLAAIAKTAEDHLTVAEFYRAKADDLNAKATGYELAAANLRNEPVVKNLTSPTAASRLEFQAKTFREDAKAARTLSVSHDEMAKTVVASLN